MTRARTLTGITAVTADTHPPSSRPRTRRVAVVAVHGVADQSRHESARAISRMLTALDDAEATTRYGAFEEKPLTVAVRPVALTGMPQGTSKTFHQQAKAGRRPDAEEADHAFLRAPLEEYRASGPDTAYETVRLEGERTGRTVHIYEMYWADLSRIGTGLVSMLGELYQLLFHVASLGKHLVNAASLGGLPGRWGTWSECESFAGRLLSGPIAILNLALLWTAAMTATAATAAMASSIQPWVAVIAPALALAWLAGTLFGHRQRVAFGVWLLPAMVIPGAAGVLLWLAIDRHWSMYRWLALEVIVAGLVATPALMRVYGRRLPDNRRLGTAILWLTGVLQTAYLLPAPNTHAGVVSAGFRVSEWLVLALLVAWAAFVGSLWVAWATTHRARRPSTELPRPVVSRRASARIPSAISPDSSS